MTHETHPHVERNRLFNTAAETLLGKRWGRRLAELLKCPQGTIASISTGRRAVTPELELRLGALIGLEIRGWEYKAAQLWPLAAQLIGSKISGDEK